jgi:hypothetical protein
MHEEWFSKFNGKNFDELEVPTKTKKTGGVSGGGSNGGTNKPKKEPYPMLGLPTMELLKDLYTKRDELYSPVCWSTVGTILRDLNIEVGKRGNITVEVIEELYKSNEGGLYKDMDIPGNRHIIGKSRELKLHDILIKKYNIQFLHNRTEEKYLPLLDCTSMKDSVDKGLKSIYGRLLATKNSELIEKYIGHFEKLKPNSFTDDDAKGYINSLIEYPMGVREDHKDSGIYRYVFNRQKENYYKLILKKFGDKVPMLFLKDEDKLKRIENEIETCKDYNDWYKKFVSKHKRILERLGRLDLLDSLEREKNLDRTEKSMVKLLKKNKGRYIQDFRNEYPTDYGWIIKNCKHLIRVYLKSQRNRKY